jgi:mercuric ion binding protein
MKAKYLILSATFTLVSLLSFGQAKTDTIKVWGNCESCKEHIEDAAKEAGATTAEWNKTTKLLVVSYDASKTTNMKIQANIAKVGYDTQDVKGKDGAYKQLDKCCQYKRKTDSKS